MNGRVLAVALTVAVTAILSFSFLRLFLTAKQDASLFDSKIAAGRDFMLVSRSINSPQKCDSTLIPLLGKWDPVNGAGNLEINGIRVTLTPSAESVETPDRGIGAIMRFKTNVSDRDLPLRLLVGEDGKITRCMIDVNALRFSLASGILPTESCVTATRTSGWNVRCPTEMFLVRDVQPGVLRCCPWGG